MFLPKEKLKHIRKYFKRKILIENYKELPKHLLSSSRIESILQTYIGTNYNFLQVYFKIIKKELLTSPTLRHAFI